MLTSRLELPSGFFVEFAQDGYRDSDPAVVVLDLIDVFLERFLYQLRKALLAPPGCELEQSGALFVRDLYRRPHEASLVGMHMHVKCLGAPLPSNALDRR